MKWLEKVREQVLALDADQARRLLRLARMSPLEARSPEDDALLKKLTKRVEGMQR